MKIQYFQSNILRVNILKIVEQKRQETHMICQQLGLNEEKNTPEW